MDETSSSGDGRTSEKRRRLTQRGDRWNRFLLTFLGPPTLGNPNEPPPAPAAPAAPCPLCGQPLAEHSYVETNGVRGLRCEAKPQ